MLNNAHRYSKSMSPSCSFSDMSAKLLLASGKVSSEGALQALLYCTCNLGSLISLYKCDGKSRHCC